ncbi:MAG: leucine-rich repeat domain-containing protein [Clostridia bacterium]|nr:leucine-rich repeat domain-containing protein [Clostridia bacterium]
MESVDNGYAVIGIGECTDTDIVIPSTHNGLPIIQINSYAFQNCTDITSIVVPDSVTLIEEAAFSGCSYVESITLPFVGKERLENALNEIALFGYIFGTHSYDGGVETNQPSSLGDNYISYIPSTLRNVTITGGNLLSNAFYNCKSLTNVTIQDSVTKIGSSAFYGCTGLTSVIIRGGVTQIGPSAFYGCTSLTSISIPNSITGIGFNAFCLCTSLANIEVDEENTKYKSIDGNLYTRDGKTLVQYAIGKKDASFTIPSGVNSIGSYAFVNCSNLTGVIIPDDVISIGHNAFSYCSNLANVTISNSILEIEYSTFENCDSLTYVTIPNGVETIGKYAFYGCDSLISVTIPDSVTSIGDQAFYYCYKLVEVINKSSLNIRAGNYAYGDVARYAIEVHKEESKIVNKDGYLFYSYNGVNYLVGYTGDDTELVLPVNYNGEDYVINNYALYNCDSITSVTIVNGISGIGSFAFEDCSGLVSVNISNSVTKVGSSAFYGCTSLTGVTIGNRVENIGVCVFYGCTSLTNISVDEGNTEYRSIDGSLYSGDGKILLQYAIGKKDVDFTVPSGVTGIGYAAFAGCESLISLTIPDSVTGIGTEAFSYCAGLVSVIIPDSVTVIGIEAFFKCTSLADVTIGMKVEMLGDYAFAGCTSLSGIKYRGTEAQWKAITKGSKWNADTGSYTITYNYTEE